jgi:hypothetical protein
MAQTNTCTSAQPVPEQSEQVKQKARKKPKKAQPALTASAAILRNSISVSTNPGVFKKLKETKPVPTKKPTPNPKVP